MEQTSNVGTLKATITADVFAGQWNQLRGAVRQWWGKLTDDDVERIAGQKDRLIGILQEKYGYSRDRAQGEVDRHVTAFREYLRQKGQSLNTVSPQGHDTAEHVGGTLHEVGDSIASHADSVKTSVADTMGSLAETLRPASTTEGGVSATATSLADNLESAANYVRESDFTRMSEDVAAIVRRYPLHSLLVGIGVGYLMASRGR
ncbi:MAG: CsbD family protein [Candidatus Binatia bacterium]